MNKNQLRTHFKNVRATLSETRRHISANKFLDHWKNRQRILTLSYASFGHEFDTFLFNRALAETRSLVLPRRKGETLQLIKVDFVPKTSYLYEPEEGEEICPSEIEQVIVPALVFDATGYRLGYGKGHYDRLLPKLKRARVFGVGFLEQLCSTPLPIEPHDQPVQFLELF